MIEFQCSVSWGSSPTILKRRVPAVEACTCIALSAAGFWNIGSCFSFPSVPIVAESAVFVSTDPRKLSTTKIWMTPRNLQRPIPPLHPVTAIRSPLDLRGADAVPSLHVRFLCVSLFGEWRVVHYDLRELPLSPSAPYA